jgi:hypothetical protein
MKTGSFPEHNQTFWQLTCIQSAGQSIPGILIGHDLAARFSAGTAFASICIGNLILWVIGISIISMTSKDRTHAIQNVKGYLGKPSSLIAALILSIAFITWYVLEIKSSIDAMNLFSKHFTEIQAQWNIKIGAFLGFFTALLAIGGITLIRRVCVAIFPLMLLFILFLIFRSDVRSILNTTWGLSFDAILLSMLITLPGFINLPTFFRHSRSREDSFLALTLITLFDVLFSSSTIIVGDLHKIADISVDYSYFIVLISFIVLSCVCLNLVNIYFVSAGGEELFYGNWGAKEYTIVGLLGTVVYTFLQIIFPMEFINNLTNNFISCLGVVLLLAFLTRIIVRHRPRRFEKIITSICWYLGCLSSLLSLIWYPEDPNFSVLVGVNTSWLCFLLIIFVEETFWSFQKTVYGSE